MFAIDVECVATGTDHNTRSVAQIAIVNDRMEIVLNAYVTPDRPVVSYLTALTGLTEDIVRQHGVPLQQALAAVRTVLPPNAVLVGQNVGQDVSWLGLKEGTDFGGLQDLQGLYRVWNERYNTWSMFGQGHLAAVLLGWQDAEGPGEHNAAQDALKSMALYNHHRHTLSRDPDAMAAAHRQLLAVPPPPSFAKRHASYEGVCMGNRRTCTCGAPFFF